MYQLTVLEIIGRLLLAVVASGVIGYDREQKNRPAGIKTHMLVCVGACVIALIQECISFDALNIAIQTPKLAGIVRADDARLTAQVVSGIGFLGAGTIIVQHRTIRGLTTAASLWTVAGIGIAVGLGDYQVAVASTVVIMGVLMLIQKLVHVSPVKRIEIQYKHKLETKEFIQNYFESQHIGLNDVNFQVTQTEQGQIYLNIYEISLPRHMNYAEVIEALSLNKNIMRIQTVSV